MNYTVFISHSSQDTWVAQQIRKQIEKTGAHTFLDKGHILAGDDFEDKIFKALQDADEMLVLLTPKAITREYIWSEIGAARVREIRIVSILYGLETADLVNKPILTRTDFIQINQDIDRYFEQLQTRVEQKLRP